MRAVQRDIERPPEGWRYTVPQTGVTLKGDFFEVVWTQLQRHCAANNLPEPDRIEVEDAACRETNPPGSRCGERKPRPNETGPIQHLMLAHVERFLKTVWQAILDRKFVSRELALKRVAICEGCPLRATMPGGCTGCYTLVKKAEGLLQKNGAIVIPEDEDGYVRDVCGACGCFIPLKVVLENSTLDKAEGEKRPAYWTGCWRNH